MNVQKVPSMKQGIAIVFAMIRLSVFRLEGIQGDLSHQRFLILGCQNSCNVRKFQRIRRYKATNVVSPRLSIKLA